MKTKPALTARHYVLAAALACTVAACVWVGRLEEVPEADIVAPTAATKRLGRSNSPASPPTAASVPRGLLQAWTTADRAEWGPALSTAGWSPPPPPPAPPPPPPPPPAPPTAPTFPYQVIGMLDDGVQKAMLAGASNTLTVKVGDVVEGQWRVEKIQPTGLHLLWLPSKLSQTVNFRSIP